MKKHRKDIVFVKDVLYNLEDLNKHDNTTIPTISDQIKNWINNLNIKSKITQLSNWRDSPIIQNNSKKYIIPSNRL
jgi:hypothetical protein